MQKQLEKSSFWFIFSFIDRVLPQILLYQLLITHAEEKDLYQLICVFSWLTFYYETGEYWIHRSHRAGNINVLKTLVLEICNFFCWFKESFLFFHYFHFLCTWKYCYESYERSDKLWKNGKFCILNWPIYTTICPNIKCIRRPAITITL